MHQRTPMDPWSAPMEITAPTRAAYLPVLGLHGAEAGLDGRGEFWTLKYFCEYSSLPTCRL